MTSVEKGGVKTWFALESNPAVMNSYLQKLGMNVDKYSFTDVFSTEDWALEMVPRPVLAVMMLFPITKETENHAEEEYRRILASGQVVSPQVKYIQQTIGNACGTIGLLHACNNAGCSDLVKPGSYLERFAQDIQHMSPADIANKLEQDEELEETHESAATEGQTEQTSEDVDTHFICFSHVDGHLYELGKK